MWRPQQQGPEEAKAQGQKGCQAMSKPKPLDARTLRWAARFLSQHSATMNDFAGPKAVALAAYLLKQEAAEIERIERKARK
jgi:hypothetical protein